MFSHNRSPAILRDLILAAILRNTGLARAEYGDANAARPAKRLLKYCDSLFTFLDHPDVPFDNNLAERMIRPAARPSSEAS